MVRCPPTLQPHPGALKELPEIWSISSNIADARNCVLPFWLVSNLFRHRRRSHGLSRWQKIQRVPQAPGFEMILPFFATREVALFAGHDSPRMYDVEDHEC